MNIETAKAFGVVVIGDEILLGKRQDRHLAHVIETLQARGMEVGWYRVVGDDRERLTETLESTQQGDIPVLCFGGIGATPDDMTRQAAADAFGAPLVRHPGAVDLIEKQFGATAYPNRILMADLPEDCLLIPNTYNKIPGFTLYEHHFFPGFPVMAWPMLDWVLDRYYPANKVQAAERALRVLGVRESDLLSLMNQLMKNHPGAKLFSLPHLGEQAYIELGFRGQPDIIDAAFIELVDSINRLGLAYENITMDVTDPAVTQVAV